MSQAAPACNNRWVWWQCPFLLSLHWVCVTLWFADCYSARRQYCSWEQKVKLLHSGCYSVLEMIGKVHNEVKSFDHDFHWEDTASCCSWDGFCCGVFFKCSVVFFCCCCSCFLFSLLGRSGWILLRAFRYSWPSDRYYLLIVVVLYAYIVLLKEKEEKKTIYFVFWFNSDMYLNF